MKMHMLVRVHMVELQTSCAKRLELRADLCRKFASNSRQKEEPNGGARHIRIEPAVPTDKTRNKASRQNGTPIDKNQMQADPQIRQPTRTRHGVGGGSAADHQARSRQNAVQVRLFDGLVDGTVEPEIVRADDQAPQLAISRLRRN
jgi:hypothetical protein